MRSVKTVRILTLLALSVFILPAVLPTLSIPKARALVSYNPPPADFLHAPLSDMGFLAVTEMNGNASQPTVTPGIAFPSPNANNNSSLKPIKANALRFINDTSYFPQTETSIAVDPSNTNHVVGGFNDQKYFFCTAFRLDCFGTGFSASVSGFTVSADGGATVLKGSDIPSVNSSVSLVPLISFGDPTVVAGANGVFYYSSLAASQFGANGIMVAKSNPNLFDPNVSCITSIQFLTMNRCWTTTLVFGNPDFSFSAEDKPVMVVDRSNGPYSGSLYVGWTHFSFFGTSASYLARCSPALDECTMLAGGNLPPISEADIFPDFTTPTVDANGNVHVAWCNYGTFGTFGPITCRIRSSPPGGTSFGRITTILSFMGPGTMLSNDTFTQAFATEQFRTASTPYLTVDSSHQSTSGNLYFTIQVCTSGVYNAIQSRFTALDNPGICGLSSIIFSRSTDGGATWSFPRTISQPAVNAQPTITVDPISGHLFVLYYTTQYDPFNHRIDIAALKSTDGGSTFRQTRLTSVSNEPDSDPNMFVYFSRFGGSWSIPQYGDYFQGVFIGGTLWTLFTANYAVEQGTFQTDPFLSVLSHIPLFP